MRVDSQGCLVAACGIASPVVREKGMWVGKGKGYNDARAANAFWPVLTCSAFESYSGSS